LLSIVKCFNELTRKLAKPNFFHTPQQYLFPKHTLHSIKAHKLHCIIIYFNPYMHITTSFVLFCTKSKPKKVFRKFPKNLFWLIMNYEFRILNGYKHYYALTFEQLEICF